MGYLLSFLVDVGGQRGLVAAVMATAWDTCCRRRAAAHNSVGYLLSWADGSLHHSSLMPETPPPAERVGAVITPRSCKSLPSNVSESMGPLK